jgi:hypothetical protein
VSTNSQSITVTVESEDGASLIVSELAVEGAVAQTFQRENFDGNAVTWVVVAQSAIVTLPKILEALAKVIASCKVRSVRIGDRELRNPTAVDIRALKG